MVVVVQRAAGGSVMLKGDPGSARRIGRGCVLLVGIATEDTPEDARRLATQVSKVRLLDDEAGKMSLSLRDVQAAEVLAVSQFTLLADFSKGNRPSFHRAARAEAAQPLFELFVASLGEAIGRPVTTGFFGEDMEVTIVNDGPVTVVLY